MVTGAGKSAGESEGKGARRGEGVEEWLGCALAVVASQVAERSDEERRK